MRKKAIQLTIDGGEETIIIGAKRQRTDDRQESLFNRLSKPQFNIILTTKAFVENEMNDIKDFQANNMQLIELLDTSTPLDTEPKK